MIMHHTEITREQLPNAEERKIPYQCVLLLDRLRIRQFGGWRFPLLICRAINF